MALIWTVGIWLSAALYFAFALLSCCALVTRPGAVFAAGEAWQFLKKSKSGMAPPDWLRLPDLLVKRCEEVNHLAGRPREMGGRVLAFAWLNDTAFPHVLVVGAFLMTIGFGLLGLATSPLKALNVVLPLTGLLVAYSLLKLRAIEKDLKTLAKTRQRAIVRELAFALDMLVMLLDAGASVDDAIESYVINAKGDTARGVSGLKAALASNPLREEFRLLLQEMRAGETKETAFRNMGARCAVPEVDRTVIAIIQAERTGTPLLDVVRAQAELLREERSQRATALAEEMAVEARLWVSVMCLVLGILLVGPFLISMAPGIRGIFGGAR